MISFSQRCCLLIFSLCIIMLQGQTKYTLPALSVSLTNTSWHVTLNFQMLQQPKKLAADGTPKHHKMDCYPLKEYFPSSSGAFLCHGSQTGQISPHFSKQTVKNNYNWG